MMHHTLSEERSGESSLWLIDPGVTFLNHGSFGGCPRPVLEFQHALRERLERQPVQFFMRDLGGMLDAARASLATFVGAQRDDVAFVYNATAGVNTVFRSLSFARGDEVLITNHVYGSCRAAAEFVANQSGAKVVVASVPFPVQSADEILAAVLAQVSPRTRLAMIEHVTSPTALIFPVERIVRALAERGIDTLVDGAHAPGMLPLQLDALGAAYYTGNCHKWLCTPKGAAFLHVRRDRQDAIHPLSFSYGAGTPLPGHSLFASAFQWNGTVDPTAWLCIPEAIRVMADLMPGGWPEVMRRNHALACTGRTILCEALGVQAPCPDELIGSLATVPLPDAPAAAADGTPTPDTLYATLLGTHKIEVPICGWPAPPKRLVRISAQLYNKPEHYKALAAALKAAL